MSCIERDMLEEKYKKEEQMSMIEYLYGVKKSTWKNMTYLDALEEKTILAQRVISEILRVSYCERDDARLESCIKAVSHNTKLSQEV